MRIILISLITLLSIPICSQDIKYLTGKDTGFRGYFTDLNEYNDKLICAFSKRNSHHSHDGRIAIIQLIDEENEQRTHWSWVQLAEIKLDFVDLRDPKLSVNSNGELILIATGVYPKTGKNVKRQSFKWKTNDGVIWEFLGKATDENLWLWSVNFSNDSNYGLSYSVGELASRESRKIRLHRLLGNKFITEMIFNDQLLDETFLPSEASLEQINDNQLISIIRTDKKNTTVVGRSNFPYNSWNFYEIPVNLHGPATIKHDDKIYIIARDVRSNGNKHLAVMELDSENKNVKTIIRINTEADWDFGYCGVVYFEGHFCISYYDQGKIKFLATKQL